MEQIFHTAPPCHLGQRRQRARVVTMAMTTQQRRPTNQHMGTHRLRWVPKTTIKNDQTLGSSCHPHLMLNASLTKPSPGSPLGMGLRPHTTACSASSLAAPPTIPQASSSLMANLNLARATVKEGGREGGRVWKTQL